jgi:AcrR family transcriptional regulator
MPRVSERYSAARRDQIVRAARHCFASNGFRGTSMQQVCAEAKLSPGAVYGYFPGKEDLVLAIADQVLTRIIPKLDGVAGRRPLPPLPETLGHLFDVLDQADEAGDLARLAVQVWAESLGNPTLAAALAAAYRRLNVRLTRLVRAYQEQGELDPGSPAPDVARVLVMLGPAFLLDRALRPHGAVDAFRNGLSGLLGASLPQR